MGEFCNTWADEDKPGYEPCEWNFIVQAERSQRIDHRPDERKDHQETALTPRDAEQAAHGRGKTHQVFLNNMDL